MDARGCSRGRGERTRADLRPPPRPSGLGVRLAGQPSRCTLVTSAQGSGTSLIRTSGGHPTPGPLREGLSWRRSNDVGLAPSGLLSADLCTMIVRPVSPPGTTPRVAPGGAPPPLDRTRPMAQRPEAMLVGPLAGARLGRCNLCSGAIVPEQDQIAYDDEAESWVHATCLEKYWRSTRGSPTRDRDPADSIGPTSRIRDTRKRRDSSHVRDAATAAEGTLEAVPIARV